MPSKTGRFDNAHYTKMWKARLEEPDHATASPSKKTKLDEVRLTDEVFFCASNRRRRPLSHDLLPQKAAVTAKREKEAKAKQEKEAKATREKAASPKPATSPKNKETQAERTARLCAAIFEQYDRGGDGYHTHADTRALAKTLGHRDIDEAYFAGLCEDLGAKSPKRGLSLKQFTTIYSDAAFGADIVKDYTAVFGKAPDEAKSPAMKRESDASADAKAEREAEQEKERVERVAKAKAEREATAKARAEKKAQSEDKAAMAAAMESAIKQPSMPMSSNGAPPPSDAIILRRFYTAHPIGKASAEEWGAQSWGHAQWAEKIGRIIGS